MRIQITTTRLNGTQHIATQQVLPGQILRSRAVPGGITALEIDGRPITGSTPVKGRAPMLQRQADDLLITVDGQTLVIIDDFFVTQGAALQGFDWDVFHAAGASQAESSTAADGAAADSADGLGGGALVSSNAVYWALGTASLVGGIAVAAGGGGSSSGGSSAAAPGQVAVSTTPLDGLVVAGPLIDGHSLTISFYRADGTLLAGPIPIDAAGRFVSSIDRSYTGSILAKVVDSNAGPDYFDEADNAPKDLVGELRAVFLSEQAESISIVVSPMSELAVRLMGVADSGTATDGLSASQITNANEAVAARLGLQNNDLFGDVVPVVDASGAQVAAPDQAGLVLAALSGLERLHGVDGAMALLAHAIQADDNDVIAAMLISGLQEAGRNAPGSYADMWVAMAPQSSAAEALRAAGQLADAAIQAWAADDVAALTASTVAAMAPRQIALLSVDAVRGFSPGQLQVLGSDDLAIVMETAQLTEVQSRALSPRALSLAIGGESPAIVITDDVGNAPETVDQTDGRAWSNDPLPVLSGRLPVQLPMAMQAALYNGDARLGTVEMGADHRAWTFTPAQPWRDGNYALNLRIQMPDGSTLPGSMSVELTIDTIPAAITIDTPISTDDLISLSDRAAGLSLTGSAPDVAEGRDMRVSLGDESKVVQIRNGRWVADFAANEIPERSGDIHVTIVTTDLAGNEATATHVVGLRTVVPVVQIDNGVAGDNRVNLREKELGVEVRGTVRNLADGQEVTLVWGGVSKTAVVANQAWAITFTSAEVPADGETQIRASARDDAGNTSASVTQAVVVRTEGAWIDIGMVADDDIINQAEAAAPVTISGTTSLPAGSQLTVNWGAWQETVIVQDGNWAVDVPTANIPADATVVVTVTADDENGEVISSAKPLTIDRAAPGALLLTLAQDTGVSSNDGISSAGTFTVANLEANAGWQYSFDGGTTWHTGVATSFLVPPATYARDSIQVRQTDQAGNISAVTSNSDVYVIDAMAPTLAITASRAQLNGDQTSTLTFTFSEVVTGFDLAHIVAAKGSVSNLVMDVGNPSVYTATYTPSQGQVRGAESISVNQFADMAGNAATAYTAPNLFIVDTVAPTVAITSSKRSLKAGETAEIRFAFSEALALAPSLDDMAVQHGVLSNLRIDGADPKVYTATFTAAADLAQGSGSVTLNAGAYADAVGNEGQAATLDNILIDTRAPTIDSVTIRGLTATDDPANRPLKTGDKIRVELAMSEPTTVRNGAPSFMIDVGASAKTAGFVMASSGTNRLVFEYVVQTGDQDAAGGITSSANALQLHGAVLQDGFGNPVSSAVVPTVQAGQNAIAVDAIVTLLTQLAITSGTGMSTTWLNAGDVVTATATFNNVVNVQGVPQLTLRIGERSVAASYVVGTGSNQLTFTYTVMAGDSDVDGISMPADALALNGGQINGLNGAPAMLALAEVSANPGFLVDTTAPVAESVVISGLTAAGQPKSTDLGMGDKIRVDVTMSEPVSISSDAVYRIGLNLKTREASYVSGTGSAVLTFEYVVAQGDVDDLAGVTAWNDALVLGDDGRFSDAAGNAASLVMPIVQDGANTIVVDAGSAAADELFISIQGGKPLAGIGDTINFGMVFNKLVNVSGRPELDFELNGVAKKAIATGGRETQIVSFKYVVQPGDEALANEIRVDPATAVKMVNGSSIRDSRDVDATTDAFQFKARTESTPFVDGRVATIETVEILSATGVNNLWLNAGDTVTVRVTFDREVELKGGNIDQEIRLLDRHLGRAEAEPVEGPTRTIDFVHTIPASAFGQVNFPADSLRITNGGALATPGGHPAVLSHAAVDSQPRYFVDSIAPEVVSVWVAGLDSSGNPKSGDLVEGDKVQMQVQVSEIVRVTGVPTYTLTVGGTAVQAQYVRVEENSDTTLIFEYALGTDQTLANEFQLNAGALGLSAGVAMIRDRAGTDITRTTPVSRYSAGKADLSAGGDDIATITAEQIAAIAPDRTYWVRLGYSDRLFAKNLGGVQYGRWQEDGVIYDRHWTVDQDGTAVHLYAQGGIAELPFTAATYTSTAVQLRFGLTLVAGGEFNAPDWRVEGGPAVTRVDDSNSSGDVLELMLAAPPAAGVLDVRYTGVDVTSSAGDPIKFSRLLIGTDAVEALDGSAFTGNQALFANGGGDVMTGGSGSDQFFAGSGNDTMTGGRGADIFSWGRRSTGSDSITDFSLAEGDRIDLRSLGLPRGFSRHAAGTALELTQASADSTDAVLKVDLGNTGQFAAPDLTITITNGWTEAGGMMLGLQTLVNQEVIRV